MMRPKIVLKQCAVPLNVIFPNGTSFAARYSLPGNIRATNTRTIKHQKKTH